MSRPGSRSWAWSPWSARTGKASRRGISSSTVRRRAALRVTLILDPTLALICWAHYAPPINNSFRKSFRKLLRWNDELPFVKFSIGDDERPLLVAELPAATVDIDALGLALAREVAVADRFLDESIDWLKGGGWPTTPGRRRRRGTRVPAARPLRRLPRRAARGAAPRGRGRRPATPDADADAEVPA